jgi:hypothetical protein
MFKHLKRARSRALFRNGKQDITTEELDERTPLNSKCQDMVSGQ